MKKLYTEVLNMQHEVNIMSYNDMDDNQQYLKGQFTPKSKVHLFLENYLSIWIVLVCVA